MAALAPEVSVAFVSFAPKIPRNMAYPIIRGARGYMARLFQRIDGDSVKHIAFKGAHLHDADLVQSAARRHGKGLGPRGKGKFATRVYETPKGWLITVGLRGSFIKPASTREYDGLTAFERRLQKVTHTK